MRLLNRPLAEYAQRLDRTLWISAKANSHFIIVVTLVIDAIFGFECIKFCGRAAIWLWPITLAVGLFIFIASYLNISILDYAGNKAALLIWLSNSAKRTTANIKLLDLSDVLNTSSAANTSEVVNVTKRSRSDDAKSKEEEDEAINTYSSDTSISESAASAARTKLPRCTPYTKVVHSEGHYKALQFDGEAIAAACIELTTSKFDSFHESTPEERRIGRETRETISIGCVFRDEIAKIKPRQPAREPSKSDTILDESADHSFTREEPSKTSSSLKRPRLVVSDLTRTLNASSAAKKSRADDTLYKAPAATPTIAPIKTPKSVRALNFDPYDELIAKCQAAGSEKRLNGGGDTSSLVDTYIERISAAPIAQLIKIIESSRKRITAPLPVPQPTVPTLGFGVAAPAPAPDPALTSIEADRGLCIMHIGRLAEAAKRLIHAAYAPRRPEEPSAMVAAVVVHAVAISNRCEHILERRPSHHQAQLLRAQIDQFLQHLAETIRDVHDACNKSSSGTQRVSTSSMTLAKSLTQCLTTVLEF